MNEIPGQEIKRLTLKRIKWTRIRTEINLGNDVTILDSRSLFSNAHYDLDKNIIMLAIDNRSSAHVNNSKKDTLVLV